MALAPTTSDPIHRLRHRTRLRSTRSSSPVRWTIGRISTRWHGLQGKCCRSFASSAPDAALLHRRHESGADREGTGLASRRRRHRARRRHSALSAACSRSWSRRCEWRVASRTRFSRLCRWSDRSWRRLPRQAASRPWLGGSSRAPRNRGTMQPRCSHCLTPLSQTRWAKRPAQGYLPTTVGIAISRLSIGFWMARRRPVTRQAGP